MAVPDLFSLLLPLAAVASAVGALASLLIAYPRAVRAARRRAAASGAAPQAASARKPAGPPAAAEPPPARVDLRDGLRNSRSALAGRLEALLRGRPRLDAETLEEVEAILFGADLGVSTADDLLQAARAAGEPGRVPEALESRALEILRSVPGPPTAAGTPHVVLVVGVNGSGKTTSIGKLAARWTAAGRRVLLAAGDTYRAAATEQLGVWAERTGSGLVAGEPGGDPAAVAFEALRRARDEGRDAVIVDTAGRLQTNQNLMDELSKIARVVGRELPGAPHETLLVLDANTGQNAIRQAQEFTRAVEVTGILLSKLDGTAKAGVVLGIAQEVGIPVRYVGVGEGPGDLQDFDAETFARALFDRPAGGEAGPGE